MKGKIYREKKNDATELRFLYALIRTYLHLYAVQCFSCSTGYTHLFA